MSNIGTTNAGKPVQGPHTVPTVGGNVQNFDGDSVTIAGICQSVNSSFVDGHPTGVPISATILLKSSQVSVTIPLQCLRGFSTIPENTFFNVNAGVDNLTATGRVVAISGSGPTAQLTVLLNNNSETTIDSQTTVIVSAEDVTASQSL